MDHRSAATDQMSGLQQLRAMADGDTPVAPISATIGMVDFEVEHGTVRVSLVPQERHYNPMGAVHGGVISTLLDTAAGCSVHSTLAAGEAYTSLDLTVKFLRGASATTGRLTAVGEVMQRGRRTALAHARLVDPDGRLIAYATSTCMIFPDS